jgi:polar amino acid transport system substrate-binding protein
MKKLLCLLMVAVMLMSCVACGGKTEDRLEKIKEKGVLEVCTEPYFAPYEFIDPSKSGDAQYVGMDIEIAKYIAQKIGVELKIVPLEFTAVQAGIAAGKYDMALSAMAYSPSRAESMNLSNVYMPSDTGYGFLVRKGDENKYNSIESLKDAVVVTQSGSVQEGLFNADITTKGCKEFKRVSAMTDGYLAVKENKADVCIVAINSANIYAEAAGGLATTDFRFTVDPNMNGTVAALPKKGTDSLMKIVNQCIKELTDNGQIQKWNDEYTAYAKTLGVE